MDKVVFIILAIGWPKQKGFENFEIFQIAEAGGTALFSNKPSFSVRNGLRKVADREIKNAPRGFDSSAVRGRLSLLKG